MRLLLTQEEKELTATLQKQCAGRTFEEIEQALAQLSGIVSLQRKETSNKITFHLQEADSHEQGTSSFR